MPTLLLLLRWLLVALLAATLVALALRGTWRSLRILCAYTALAGVALATHIRLEEWFGASWLSWNAALSGFRVLLAIEAVWLAIQAASVRDRWSIAGFAGAFAGAIGVASWVALPSEFYYRFAGFAAQLHAVLLLFVAAAVALCWRYDVRIGWLAIRHCAILGVLLGNHVWSNVAHPVTGREWRLENAIYLAVAIGCYAAWLWLAVSRSGSDGAPGDTDRLPTAE